MGKPLVLDTLYNLISGLGTAKDKAAFSRYVFGPMQKDQLDAAYRSDWIARKIVDVPAKDSTREWREWQADNEQIEELERCERELLLQQKLQVGLVRARLYGGCALIMGIGTQDPEKELDPETVGEGDLRFVHAISRWELSTGPIIWDVKSPWYGEPEWYQRRIVGSTADATQAALAAQVKVHPSRVVRLLGAPLPDPSINSESGWGDSVLQAVNDAVMNAGMVTGAIAALLNEAKVDVIKIPQLSEHLSTKEYQTRLTERLMFANQAKSIVNALVLDKEEDWDRIEANVGSLSPLIQEYLAIASGAADIPATRMLGNAPKGMNATGAGDIRNYYDRISSDQASDLTPALSRLDEVLVRSALGKRDPDVHYLWKPLWQLDEVQKGALWYQKAQAFQIDLNGGLIPPEVLREARQNQLIEDGVYPGLEQVLDDWETGALEPDPEPEPPDPAMLAQMQGALGGPKPPLALPKPGPGKPPSGTQKSTPSADARHEQRNRRGKFRRVPAHLTELQRSLREHYERTSSMLAEYMRDLPEDLPVGDAAPRTLYVRRDVTNAAEISRWAKAQGFKELVDDPHVTLAFSRAPVDWMKMGGYPESEELVVPSGGPRLVEQLGGEGAVVLLFASSSLSWRHEDMKRNGASWDYAEFQPHVTITYDAGDLDLSAVEPYRGKIVLGPEVFEEIS